MITPKRIKVSGKWLIVSHTVTLDGNFLYFTNEGYIPKDMVEAWSEETAEMYHRLLRTINGGRK